MAADPGSVSAAPLGESADAHSNANSPSRGRTHVR